MCILFPQLGNTHVQLSTCMLSGLIIRLIFVMWWISSTNACHVVDFLINISFTILSIYVSLFFLSTISLPLNQQKNGHSHLILYLIWYHKKYYLLAHYNYSIYNWGLLKTSSKLPNWEQKSIISQLPPQFD